MSRRFPRSPVMRAALGALLLAAAFGAAAVPEAQFHPAFEQFVRASAGESGAIAPAADAFAALLKAEPGNPVLMVYGGAVTTLKARAAWLPWQKMGYAEDGLALIDKALATLGPAHDAPLQHETPASLEVRFVAASTFLQVPGFMNRGARGAKLLDEVLASPLLAQAPLSFRGNVWMRAAAQARAEKRAADARRWYAEVLSHAAPQAALAKAALAEIGS